MQGTQIRNFRENKGLSLRAFGKQIGVSGEWIRQLEAADYIAPEQRERICKAFNVDLADPLFFTEPIRQTQQTHRDFPEARRERISRTKAEREALRPIRAESARNIRRAAGLSQKELAAAMGTYQSHISAWERGLLFISKETLMKIEKAAAQARCEKEVKAPKPTKKKMKGCGGTSQPAITVCRSGLLFSKGMVEKLGGSGHVKVYYQEEERLLAIMPAMENEDGALRLYTKGQPVKLNNTGVRKVAEKLLGFKVENGGCKVMGTWKLDEEYEYWLFDMSAVMGKAG